MKFKLTPGQLIAIREENFGVPGYESNDKKYYGIAGGKGESNLLHAIKTELNRRGFDLIKKRMWKDGHLMDDLQQYLRTRSARSSAPHISLHNGSWAIAGIEESWNDDSRKYAVLQLTTDIWEKQPDCFERMKALLEAKPVESQAGNAY